jgi:hypothetical protein
MNGSTLSELERLDQETARRIYDAFSETDYEIRRAKRALRTRVQTAIAEHRDGILGATQPQKTSKIKGPVDYDRLKAILQMQPLTYEIIRRETGLSDGGIAEVIDMLSLECALWKPAKGIYELLR